MHLRPGGGQGIGRGIRASQPEDRMARPDELGNDGGADGARRTGDENAHEKPPVGGLSRATGRARGRAMSVAVITLAPDVSRCHRYDRRMGRWEPNARDRLAQAALVLYSERGFEPTTVAEIAKQAGLTER